MRERSPYVKVKLTAANSPNTPWVIGTVASNPKTPPEMLATLAKDSTDTVRRAVASNPNTPPEELTTLAKNRDFVIRTAVASNPKTPLEVLIHLVGDQNQDSEDKKAVIRNKAMQSAMRFIHYNPKHNQEGAVMEDTA